jgi:hypothetical protein
MSDIYLALACVGASSLLAGILVARVARHCSTLQRNLLGTAIVLAMIVYARVLWQNTALIPWLPLSSLVIVGNWFPLFLGALAGIVVQTETLSRFRRGLIVAVLSAFAAYASLSPVVGSTPQCADRWTMAGDCVQTTQFTCSPASAATLLRMHGIAATEREMADLCLTHQGTSSLGLYRGLKLKTQGTRWDVQVVHCSAAEVVRFSDRPLIADVGLEAGQPLDSTFRTEFGWTPGARHTVIINGFSLRRASVIDPSPHIGREEWDADTLRMLWRGYGLRLVER